MSWVTVMRQAATLVISSISIRLVTRPVHKSPCVLARLTSGTGDLKNLAILGKRNVTVYTKLYNSRSKKKIEGKWRPLVWGFFPSIQIFLILLPHRPRRSQIFDTIHICLRKLPKKSGKDMPCVCSVEIQKFEIYEKIFCGARQGADLWYYRRRDPY